MKLLAKQLRTLSEMSLQMRRALEMYNLEMTRIERVGNTATFYFSSRRGTLLFKE